MGEIKGSIPPSANSFEMAVARPDPLIRQVLWRTVDHAPGYPVMMLIFRDFLPGFRDVMTYIIATEIGSNDAPAFS
jgi:hypothetical protein